MVRSRRSTVLRPQPSSHGNLAIGVSLEPQRCDLPQGFVGQIVEKPAAFIGHESGQLWAGLVCGRLGNPAGLERRRGEIGFGSDLAAAAFQSPLVLNHVGSLPGGDRHQDPPEIGAVVELGKTTLPGASAKAVEGGKCRVLFVGGRARGVA